MQGSFVNLNRVRQQQAQALAAAEAARVEAEAAATARAQPEETAPSTPPASSSLSPPRPAPSTGPSPPRSPFRAPQIQSSLLVRRHNTVGGKPQRTRSVKRVEEEDEEGATNGDIDGGGDSFDGDSASVTTEESGILPGASGLTRHGSLPTRTAPYPISPVRSGFSSASRPRFGSHRSSGPTTPYESIASVTGAANELHAYGAEDDEEWERALAEGRRNGGAAAAGEDYYDPEPEILSSSAPKGSSQLQHQRSLPHQRSLNFINTSGSASAGSRSPPLLPPHQYHQQQQQQQAGSSFFPSSSNPPTSPSYEDTSFNHQRSISSKTSVESSIASGGPTIRRHQSLTQAGVHTRISDRLNRSPFTDPNSRNGSDDDPPTSPVKRSPWNSPQQDLLSRQRSWDGDQSQGGAGGGGSGAGGPLSPVPGSGSRWRREESGSSAEGAMSAEQLQNAFDAISLGRSMAASTSSLQPPPPLPRSGATSPDPYTHSRSASGSNPNALVPPQPIDRARHSRSPSLNPPPPRFASPSPGPPSSTTPTPNDAPLRPSVTVPSFPHHHRPGLSNNPSPASSGNGNIKLSLITDATALAQGGGGNNHQPRVGPQSAAAYVPPVGHSTQPPTSSGGFAQYGGGGGGGLQFGGPLVGGGVGMGGGAGGYAGGGGSNGIGHLSNHQPKQAPFTAMGTGWEQKHNILGSRPQQHQPQLPYGAQQQQMFGAYGGAQQQQFGGGPPMQQSFGQQANFLSGGGVYGGGGVEQVGAGGGMMGGVGGLASPVDVPSLVQQKGYNPAVFDTNPTRARFFVIKSYTEDDVAKSLKFEIWSSTTFGNKRLDKAFKESAAVMPIYLFFSVNSSGHFAGVAQMLTEVDYNTTSTVWAQDKWKGVFRLRWVFVKDVPNQALRHIRLNNTQERKPVTNSRDTQELLPEAGCEMLSIFHAYQSRTSLLQDYAFYDLQSIQKDLQTQAETARQQQQPIAHLPPFPAQPTFVPQPLGPNYASSTVYAGGGGVQQQPSLQGGGGIGQQGRY